MARKLEAQFCTKTFDFICFFIDFFAVLYEQLDFGKWWQNVKFVQGPALIHTFGTSWNPRGTVCDLGGSIDRKTEFPDFLTLSDVSNRCVVFPKVSLH